MYLLQSEVKSESYFIFCRNSTLTLTILCYLIDSISVCRDQKQFTTTRDPKTTQAVTIIHVMCSSHWLINQRKSSGDTFVGTLHPASSPEYIKSCNSKGKATDEGLEVNISLFLRSFSSYMLGNVNITPAEHFKKQQKKKIAMWVYQLVVALKRETCITCVSCKDLNQI